jgi:hypothetical protein
MIVRILFLRGSDLSQMVTNNASPASRTKLMGFTDYPFNMILTAQKVTAWPSDCGRAAMYVDLKVHKFGGCG